MPVASTEIMPLYLKRKWPAIALSSNRDLCTTSDSFQLYSPNNSPVKKQLFKANMLILLHIYLDKQLRFRHNSFK
jgi:hypothetical protein